MPEGYMTTWLIFSLVMPAVVVGFGWLAVLHQERYLSNRRPLADPSFMEDRAQHRGTRSAETWEPDRAQFT